MGTPTLSDFPAPTVRRVARGNGVNRSRSADVATGLQDPRPARPQGARPDPPRTRWEALLFETLRLRIRRHQPLAAMADEKAWARVLDALPIACSISSSKDPTTLLYEISGCPPDKWRLPAKVEHGISGDRLGGDKADLTKLSLIVLAPRR